MRVALFIIAMGFFLGSVLNARSAESVYSKRVGNWLVVCYEEGAVFSHCGTATSYSTDKKVTGTGELHLILRLDSAGVAKVSLAGTDWRHPHLTALKYKAEYSDGAVSTARARNAGTPPGMSNFLTDPFEPPVSGGMLQSFMNSQHVTLTLGGRELGQYSLNGSSAAVMHLIDVVTAFSGDPA